MLLTSFLAIILNIIIAWVLAGGGWKKFKQILLGIIIGVRDDPDQTKESNPQGPTHPPQPQSPKTEQLGPSPSNSNDPQELQPILSRKSQNTPSKSKFSTDSHTLTAERFKEFELVSDQGSQLPSDANFEAAPPLIFSKPKITKRSSLQPQGSF